ncbi:MAG: hypothetical protein IJ711_05295 [Lachnospiraceae bacterium]|nr:hypothetical protein [Lachnospiraceae bacterium]
MISEERIMQIQEHLREKGYYSGDVKGEITNEMISSIKIVNLINDTNFSIEEPEKIYNEIQQIVLYSSIYDQYGAAISGATWAAGYSNSSLTPTDCLARVIYAEDTTHTNGHYAVAKVIYNRYHFRDRSYFSRNKLNPPTWKSILFKSGAFSTTLSSCANAYAPTHNSFWNSAVDRAVSLVAGAIPSSSVGSQPYFRTNGSALPSDASSIITVGGNTFFHQSDSV